MSSGYTIIQYGFVTLYQVVTEDVHQEMVWDDSHTDLLYVRTTIQVSGFLHGHGEWLYQGAVYAGQNNNAGNAAANEYAVRRNLEPRQRFTMKVGCSPNNLGQIPDGIILFDVLPFPANQSPPGSKTTGNISLIGYDLANGPKCHSFRVSHITGNELFRVQATFEICHLECEYTTSDNVNNYGVVSNRWSIQDSLNVNNQLVRTYSGQLVVASQNINISSFRYLANIPLQPLLRIESMDFTVSTDGLKLNWQIVQREVAAAAPWPARTWSVTQTEEQVDGMKGICSIDVDLTGDTQVDKAQLIRLAYWIIFAKVFDQTPNFIFGLDAGAQANLFKKFALRSISFTDYIGVENRIVARAVVERQAEMAVQNADMAFLTLGKPLLAANLPAPNSPNSPIPVYNQSLSWGAYSGQIPEIEGPAKLAGIFGCFLQTPCNNVHGIYTVRPNPVAAASQTVQGPTQANIQQEASNPDAVPATVTIVTEIPDLPNYYSASQDEAIYTHWQIDTVFDKNNMVVGMPVANPITTGPNYLSNTVYVQLSGPQGTRKVRVSAERLGEEPEFPNADALQDWIASQAPYVPGSGITTNPVIQQKLIRQKIRPGTPMITVLGQKMYRADAVYLFILSRTPNPDEQLPLGDDKWNNFGPQQTGVAANLTNSNWQA